MDSGSLGMMWDLSRRILRYWTIRRDLWEAGIWGLLDLGKARREKRSWGYLMLGQLCFSGHTIKFSKSSRIQTRVISNLRQVVLAVSSIQSMTILR